MNKQQGLSSFAGRRIHDTDQRFGAQFSEFRPQHPAGNYVVVFAPLPGDVTHLLSMAASLEIFVLLLLVGIIHPVS